MTSTDDKEKNLDQAFAWIEQAAARGADWVLLPEVFAFHGSYEHIYQKGERSDGDLIKRLSETARKNKICLFAGSFGEQPQDDDLQHGTQLESRLGHKRVYNSCFVFDRSGKKVAHYRKTHLFNMLNDQGQPLYCESDGFLAGNELVAFDLEGFRVGLAICYDLRFPSLFEKLAEECALDIIALPSAFTQQTGMDHWELLLRARAVEQQSYVFASNQTGHHGSGKHSYGHSMIVDPWGFVLANTGTPAGLALAEVSRSRLSEVRQRLPALRNRRPELYD
jgi:predicted amidohydrolase